MKLISKSKSALLCAGLGIFLSGCASVTISPVDAPKLTSTPTYEQRMDFFFWGLTPDVQQVSVNDVCVGTGVRQMQAQTKLEDGIFTVITLGIFSPRSVKVWCEEA
ncbi:Bor family protein [Reinekea blandensis]|uniref:Bor family protein n=1 Tax=Reinekea blandensis MED297 TaxID=314283 RepID=A4BI53_9GAMM|nr:Bor family protein [Reinekea blandensis]EAR08196.1 hypothetical protein MED297_14695 [Reinekea sp. MED297] [Reinekea blandensis MED297]